ncbi:glycosyltransferase family 4 protein [Schumannella luteola]
MPDVIERRLVVEQFDPDRPKPGGIDTCIRGLIAFAPPGVELWIAGVDATGTKAIGEWTDRTVGDRTIKFMPLARLDNADLTRRVPHSWTLRRGLRKYRPLPDADVVQAHRINIGAAILADYPDARHVQFIHSSGVENLGSGSKSFFRRAVFYYRLLESRVVPRMDDVVVFSRSGAQRLEGAHGAHVRFSPTWFDPTAFRPDGHERTASTAVLWACRIEPAKDPVLAVEVAARLPQGYRLTVAGSGTMAAEMQQRVRDRGIEGRVDFLGAVPKHRMGEVMARHDVLLMTSRFEGFSRSIVEALASGLPVATTPGGEPNGLVIEGVNGARAEAVAEELADAVVRAARLDPVDARSSVADLSAARLVPIVLGA